jgi:hypothetical protein
VPSLALPRLHTHTQSRTTLAKEQECCNSKALEKVEEIQFHLQVWGRAWVGEHPLVLGAKG